MALDDRAEVLTGKAHVAHTDCVGGPGQESPLAPCTSLAGGTRWESAEAALVDRGGAAAQETPEIPHTNWAGKPLRWLVLTEQWALGEKLQRWLTLTRQEVLSEKSQRQLVLTGRSTGQENH